MRCAPPQWRRSDFATDARNAFLHGKRHFEMHPLNVAIANGKLPVESHEKARSFEPRASCYAIILNQ
jgi:hypothetical protein